MKLKCKECGEEFEATPPLNADDYTLTRWKEEHRLCEECAEVPRPLNGLIDYKWDGGRFNPNEHDKHKIGSFGKWAQEQRDDKKEGPIDL